MSVQIEVEFVIIASQLLINMLQQQSAYTDQNVVVIMEQNFNKMFPVRIRRYNVTLKLPTYYIILPHHISMPAHLIFMSLNGTRTFTNGAPLGVTTSSWNTFSIRSLTFNAYIVRYKLH